MKFYYLISFIGLFLFSCEQEKENYLVKAEGIVEQTYENRYSSFSGSDEKVNSIELYKKIEDYYLFLDLLKSRSQSDYDEFYTKCIQNDTVINFECLYKNHPYVESLILPSNLSNNFFAFEKGMEGYKNHLTEESQIIKAYGALLKMKSGMHLAFDDYGVFAGYLNAIDTQDFEDKIIYRLPIIAFSHVILSEREQVKKNRERRKNKVEQ